MLSWYKEIPYLRDIKQIWQCTSLLKQNTREKELSSGSSSIWAAVQGEHSWDHVLASWTPLQVIQELLSAFSHVSTKSSCTKRSQKVEFSCKFSVSTFNIRLTLLSSKYSLTPSHVCNPLPPLSPLYIYTCACTHKPVLTSMSCRTWITDSLKRMGLL
jgi:hypothetical protein